MSNKVKKHIGTFIFTFIMLIFISLPNKSMAYNTNMKSAMAYLHPLIKTNNSYDTYFKVVTIYCQNGYKCEYSMDFGTTWKQYNKSFIVDKNSTILSRMIDDNGNILTTSSYVITTIRK